MNNAPRDIRGWEQIIEGYVADPDGAHTVRDFEEPGLLVHNAAAAYGLKAPRRGSVLRRELDGIVLAMTPPHLVGDMVTRVTAAIVRGEQ